MQVGAPANILLNIHALRWAGPVMHKVSVVGPVAGPHSLFPIHILYIWITFISNHKLTLPRLQRQDVSRSGQGTSCGEKGGWKEHLGSWGSERTEKPRVRLTGRR